MAAIRLSERRVPKPWGRRDLPEMFGAVAPDEAPVGEIWFGHPDGDDVELLVKYLFTSEKLSIQVHPDDEAAARSGHRRGKDEAWIVLKAEPGAAIGTGLSEPLSATALLEAALDGSIEARVAWSPAAAGDVYYSPAGTVHAIGAGLTLIEVQQNVDLTYRLYDYGRPRELNLDEGVAAAKPASRAELLAPAALGEGREMLARGRAFQIERWTGPLSATLRAASGRRVWLVPVASGGRIDGRPLAPGTVWLADGPAALALEPACELLVAYAGGDVLDDLRG